MHLPAIQTENKAYTLLQLDRLLEMSQILGWDPADSRLFEQLEHFAWYISQYLSPEVSGLVLHPYQSFHALQTKHETTGVLLALEAASQDTHPENPPLFPEKWGVEQVRNNYGVAKLSLFYHPQEKEAVKKKKLVAELSDFTNYEEIDFLLDLHLYSLEGATLSPNESLIQAVQEFRSSCDLLALAPPQDPLTAATITAELDIPWLVTDHGLEYEHFKEKMRSAFESGASGFMASDSIWFDLAQAISQAQVSEDEQEDAPELNTAFVDYLRTTVRDRLLELSRIANEEVGQTADSML